MKVGFVILCRYNSSRLPGKILKKIDNKSILSHVYDQLSEVVSKDAIVVATSDEHSDDPIIDYCEKNSIPTFRGSLVNVAQRFMEAAQKMNFEYACRINGDNLFINQDLILKMTTAALSGSFDFLSNVPGRTWGYGMSIECVKTSFYAEVYNTFNTEDHYEHVTIFLYDNEEVGKRKYFENKTFRYLKDRRLAVDTAEDFDNLTSLYFEVKKRMISKENKISVLNKLLKEVEL